MEELKNIVIVFENCEVLKLSPKIFDYIKLEDITTNYSLNMWGQFLEQIKCKDCYLKINKSKCNSKVINELERINCYKDIASIELTFKDKSKKYMYVDWNYEDDYSNSYQEVIDSDRNVIVHIIADSKDKL